MRYKFLWDATKAIANYRKHRVPFVTAMSVLEDPRSRSRYDAKHSEAEERWATVGKASTGEILVVIHTFAEKDAAEAEIRIISARKATRYERTQYEEPSNYYWMQEPMEPEYDFSKGERGRFFRKDAVFEAPIEIDPILCERLRDLAKARGIGPGDLMNELLKRGLDAEDAGK